MPTLLQFGRIKSNKLQAAVKIKFDCSTDIISICSLICCLSKGNLGLKKCNAKNWGNKIILLKKIRMKHFILIMYIMYTCFACQLYNYYWKTFTLSCLIPKKRREKIMKGNKEINQNINSINVTSMYCSAEVLPVVMMFSKQAHFFVKF